MAAATMVSLLPGGTIMSIVTSSSIPVEEIVHLGGLAAVAALAVAAAMVIAPSCPVGDQRLPAASIFSPPLLCHAPLLMPIVCGSHPRAFAYCGEPRLIHIAPPLSDRLRLVSAP